MNTSIPILTLAAPCAASLAARGGGAGDAHARSGQGRVVTALPTVYPVRQAGRRKSSPRTHPRHGLADHRIDRHRRRHQPVLRRRPAPTHPDIANASRRMKVPASSRPARPERRDREITEIQVGLDGIAFASAQGGITMNPTPGDRLPRRSPPARSARSRPRKTWRDVDPSLPNKPILVYGPPSTSGTRDALKELVLIKGCESNAGDEGAQGQRQGSATSSSAPSCARTAPMSTRASRTT